MPLIPFGEYRPTSPTMNRRSPARCSTRCRAARHPGQSDRQEIRRRDQFGIGTLSVKAPTHLLAFCGPKLVWQITHAGWKLLSGIERR